MTNEEPASSPGRPDTGVEAGAVRGADAGVDGGAKSGSSAVEATKATRADVQPPQQGWFVRLFGGALGIFWCLAGIFKLLDWVANSSPWSWGVREPVWTDQFGSVALIGVSFAEVLLGIWLLLRPGRVTAAMGLMLLVVFTVALLVRPPQGESCGCLGILGPVIDFQAGDPHARNAVLALGHALVMLFARTK